jgi:hypothetical protein
MTTCKFPFVAHRFADRFDTKVINVYDAVLQAPFCWCSTAVCWAPFYSQSSNSHPPFYTRRLASRFGKSIPAV